MRGGVARVLVVAGLAACGDSWHLASDANLSDGGGEATKDATADAPGTPDADAGIDAPVTHLIAGSITGLAGSGLVLRNNGGDDLAVPANATSFTFATPVADAGAYDVSVASQPSSPTQTCSVSNGSGTALGDVSDVQVVCASQAFTVGGSVAGLAAGTSVAIQLDGGTDLVLSANGPFTFATPVASGASYAVTVHVQPADQECTVAQGTGTIGAAPVTDVTVTCVPALGFTRVPVAPGLGNANLASGNFAAMPLLSQTGVYADISTRTLNPAFVPYAVNTRLWSDGAVKTRWVAVPNDGAPYDPGERVAFQANGLWTFPVGTVTLKLFELVVDETTGARKQLELRVAVRLPDGTFGGASYRWRADGSDADLVQTTVDEVNTITTATGTRSQTHTYPEPGLCVMCHVPTAGFALGLRTWQLNGSFTYPSGSTENQLLAWGRAEMFSGGFAEADIPSFLRTVPITDSSASLVTRARSYFEANCSPCHHPGGPNNAWDARFTTPLASQGLLGMEVKLGDPDGSKLYQRMSYAAVDTPTKANQMMPPLAKNHVDTYALSIVRLWILSL